MVSKWVLVSRMLSFVIKRKSIIITRSFWKTWVDCYSTHSVSCWLTSFIELCNTLIQLLNYFKLQKASGVFITFPQWRLDLPYLNTYKLKPIARWDLFFSKIGTFRRTSLDSNHLPWYFKIMNSWTARFQKLKPTSWTLVFGNAILHCID